MARFTTINATLPNGSATQADVDRAPNECPLCHHAIMAVRLEGAVWRMRSKDHVILDVPFRCPRTTCGSLFIARYLRSKDNPGHYNLHESVPRNAKPARFDPELVAMSASFIEIYTQALEAEAHGLDQITGVALRKSLEFLIKDYCIHKEPAKDANIRKMFLGNCIKDLVTDPNVRRCAERATWLGNDETHYTRKWTNHDIRDLKTLLGLTASWITNELLTEKYLKEMQP